MLKPQDLLIALELHLLGDRDYTFAELGKTVGICTAEAHHAVMRCRDAKLIAGKMNKVNRTMLTELATMAFPGIHYPVLGKKETGLVTGIHRLEEFAEDDEWTESLKVWPIRNTVLSPEELKTQRANNEFGFQLEESLEPLYPTAIQSILHEPRLLPFLALIDVIRCHRGEVRKKAISLLAKKIKETAG